MKHLRARYGRNWCVAQRASRKTARYDTVLHPKRYEKEREPTLLFLYNPFGRETMEKVAGRVRASLEARPRELIVLYLNPFQLDAWLETGFRLIHRGGHFAILRV